MSVQALDKINELPSELVPCFLYFIGDDMKRKLPQQVYEVKLEEAVERIKHDAEMLKGKSCDELRDYFDVLKKELFPGAFSVYLARTITIPKDVANAIVDWLADNLPNATLVSRRNGYEGVLVRLGEEKVIVLFKHKHSEVSALPSVYGIANDDNVRVVLIRPRDVQMFKVIDGLIKLKWDEKLIKDFTEVELTRDELASIWVASAGTLMRGDLMARYSKIAEQVLEKIKKAVYGKDRTPPW